MSSHAEKDLDLHNAERRIWLVKVPKYIAKKWEKAPSNLEVAKLKIVKNLQKEAEITLKLSDSVLALKEPGDYNIPQHHKLDVTTVRQQTLGVFSNITSSAKSDRAMSEAEKLYIEGKIVQKLEFRPQSDDTYMKLKLESIKKASIPQRRVQQLQKAVNNFKPVSNHKNNIAYAEKKKSEGKKIREDKGVVLEILFGAFEKHQYYNIKDLVNITKQPVVYLKEILNEVCNYNLKNPHRNMWELKPEYRYYKQEKSANQ